MATSRFRLTIFRKGLLLISLPLLFQFIIVATLFNVQRDAADAENLASHSKDVLNKIQDAVNELAIAQGAARGAVITTQERFQDQVKFLTTKTLADFDELIVLVNDNPRQQDRARRVRAEADTLISWINDQVTMSLAGDSKKAVEHVRSMRGVELMDAVLRESSAFQKEELRLSKERTDNVAHTRAQQRWALIVGTIGATIVTCLAAYIFGKSIASRLSVTTQNARNLAVNQPLLPPIAGSDELVTLDVAMHEASRRLLHAAETERSFKNEIERRADDLARANESLRQQTQENEMFVYSVSHDLRSPLVNLQGFSRELMHAGDELKRLLSDEAVPPKVRTDVDTVIEQDVLSSVKFIQTAVSRSSAIIDSLLRLSRAGRVEYRMVEVDVNHVVQRIIDAMASTIQEKNATFVVNELPPAYGDATAVEQIFGNLIGNAVNYLDPKRSGRIEVGVLNQGQPDAAGLRIYYVEDNGLGIAAAYIDKIFVAFQRLHGDIAKGEGIGLALVRRMIERHGGRAWVESVVGQGTTFFVALPAGPAKAIDSFVSITDLGATKPSSVQSGKHTEVQA